MLVQIEHTILLSMAFIVLFGIAEFLYRQKIKSAEQTRKLVHFGCGIMSLSFPFMLNSHWNVLLLCGSFFGILLISQRLGVLNAINGVKRKTSGAQLFPIVVYSCYLAMEHFESIMYYFLPIVILSICDPLAALVGKKFAKRSYCILGHRKTYLGSLAFLLSSIAICCTMNMGLLYEFEQFSYLQIFSIGIATTLAEALVKNGYDNLSIPATTLLILNYFSQPTIFA